MSTPSASAQGAQPLTNLAHLDWLGATVSPPVQAGHTTYLLAQQPSINVLWTYAEPDADDMARAAVVYLRHWKQTGSASSRAAAHGMLRDLTYLQTSGSRRGPLR